MSTECALDALQALANPARLLIFRTLMRHEPDGLYAGALGERLGMRHTTLSNHLAVLSRAGLICGSREGRNVRYRACVEGMQALLGFLLKDCCEGHPEACVQLQTAETSQAMCECAAEVPAHPRKRSN
ncbi:MAG: ArsR family transcriptional regulator [Lysobacteraceae bacterium SCN 69-123]|nr:MAG: ArsR family transcriptional regulator [Xanthomonadaceae bacterium SCN 69-123]OJY94602.1 MAG: ArsR family transcriptional regulator [Xanthomonadales bacterium 63-13]